MALDNGRSQGECKILANCVLDVDRLEGDAVMNQPRDSHYAAAGVLPGRLPHCALLPG